MVVSSTRLQAVIERFARLTAGFFRTRLFLLLKHKLMCESLFTFSGLIDKN